MFAVDCSHCGTRYLVSTDAIVSLHNTNDGPVAYARCPEGHLLVHLFAEGRTLASVRDEVQVA